ncbi:hypothetical protein KUL17_41030 [Alteromonas sp. KUL17]|nr:hypothetical protein KUL17_41030 [Alteromonas sp. KUL17]
MTWGNSAQEDPNEERAHHNFLTVDGKHRGAQKPMKSVSVIRYADDFVITAHSQAFFVDTILPCINEFMSQRDLALPPEKAHVPYIRGF